VPCAKALHTSQCHILHFVSHWLVLDLSIYTHSKWCSAVLHVCRKCSMAVFKLRLESQDSWLSISTLFYILHLVSHWLVLDLHISMACSQQHAHHVDSRWMVCILPILFPRVTNAQQKQNSSYQHGSPTYYGSPANCLVCPSASLAVCNH
jgi:hypothetical protein